MQTNTVDQIRGIGTITSEREAASFTERAALLGRLGFVLIFLWSGPRLQSR